MTGLQPTIDPAAVLRSRLMKGGWVQHVPANGGQHAWWTHYQHPDMEIDLPHAPDHADDWSSKYIEDAQWAARQLVTAESSADYQTLIDAMPGAVPPLPPRLIERNYSQADAGNLIITRNEFGHVEAAHLVVWGECQTCEECFECTCPTKDCPSCTCSVDEHGEQFCQCGCCECSKSTQFRRVVRGNWSGDEHESLICVSHLLRNGHLVEPKWHSSAG